MKKAILSAAILFSTLSIFAQADQRHCKATKKDGTPCKSVIVGKNGYCNAHNPEANHCIKIKANGERCRMVIKEGETLCRFHKG